jgi:class 3 adenylate cyclase
VAEPQIDPAELERLGLYDPDDAHAAERLELIEYLLSLGATVEDLVEARDELPVVASVVALRPAGERFTLSEAAARAGMPVEKAVQIWRASGLPEPGPYDRVCMAEDVEVFMTFLAGEELLGQAVAMQMARVVGAAMARVADAAVSAFAVQLGAPTLAQDPTGLALARANTEATALVPWLSHALNVMLRRHFQVSRRPLDADSGLVRGYDSQDLAVGFIDLVDSTRLVQQLSIRELGAALTEFDVCAIDTVVAGGGRLVKLIGDEAMFIAPDAATACAIALDLADSLAAHPVLPAARGGLAAGEVLSREGDYFGPAVNLAARAVKLADPGCVLASADVARAADAYRFAAVGAQRLKGFDEPVELFRLERAPDK